MQGTPAACTRCSEMTTAPSLSRLIHGLDRGDEHAATELFTLYGRRLAALARKRLGPLLRGKVDPEDILQSVFRSFFCRRREQKLEIESWEGLWGILAVMTVRKCGDQCDRYLAACRDVRRESRSSAASGSWIKKLRCKRSHGPVEVVVLAELVEQILAQLPEEHSEIAALFLEGYSVAEISERVHYSERTVWRTIHASAGDCSQSCWMTRGEKSKQAE